ncbi:MAG: nucleotidyltransferase domain-containing protein [Phycisphaerales bacterium]|nr:nucleotidyltransferase domain-containing protein [Phycisphaerales bacterium]PCI09445.1 MAG: DNA polymerase subunit beta [bacterium]
MTTPRIDIPMDKLVELCKRWKIVELSLFGSVLRVDFTPESDVDVMIVLADDVTISSFDDWLAIRDELSELFDHRKIDLVERKRIINPFMRHSILTTRKAIYAA